MLRIIKPLEKDLVSKQKNGNKTQSDLAHLESPNPSSEEDNEEQMLVNMTERNRRPGMKEKKADMRHILGFLN